MKPLDPARPYTMLNEIGTIHFWEPGDATRYGIIVVPVTSPDGFIELEGMGGVEDRGVLVTSTLNGKTALLPEGRFEPILCDLFEFGELMGITNPITLFQMARAVSLIRKNHIYFGDALEALRLELIKGGYPEACTR